jgi:hypothetical protein
MAIDPTRREENMSDTSDHTTRTENARLIAWLLEKLSM